MAEIGRYRVIAQLGRGGMAEVFEALHLGENGFQRRVAIKRLLPGRELDPASARMFLDEARLASFLHHSNVVAVLDYGIADGLPFQVLEFVDGVDLSRLDRVTSAEGLQMPVACALYIAAELAHGLDHAHEAKDEAGRPLGIVHRDVSPKNVLVSWSGDVKLADFGVAFARERAERTQGGVAKGTAAYMAPEQAVGGEPDARTDVFAAGCVLHWLLTGESPLARDGASARLLAGNELELSPELPDDVRAIIARAVKPSRAERQGSARELAGDLGRALANRAEGDPKLLLRQFLQTAQPFFRQDSRYDSLLEPKFELVGGATRSDFHFARAPSTGSFTGLVSEEAAPRRSRTALLGTIAALALLLSFAGVRRWSDAGRPSVVVADFDNRTGAPELDSLSGLFIQGLEHSRRLDVLTRARALDALRDGGDVPPALAPERGAELLEKTGADYLLVGRVSGAAPSYRVEVQAFRAGARDVALLVESAEGDDPRTLIARLAMRVRKELGDPAAASPAPASSPPSLSAYRAFFEGEQALAQHRHREAEPLFRAALREDPGFALAHYRLAFVLDWRGRDGAKAHLEEALRRRDSFGPRERFMLDALDARVNGDPARAMRILDEMLRSYPEEKEALFLSGDLRFHHGDATAAIPRFRRVIDLDPRFESAWDHLMSAYVHADRRADARALALDATRRLRTHAAFASATDTLLAIGALEDAEAVAREAADLFAGEHAPLVRLAGVRLFRGAAAEAEALLQGAGRKAASADARMNVALSRARFCAYLGRFAASRRSYEEAMALGESPEVVLRVRAELGLFLAFGPRDREAARAALDEAGSSHDSVVARTRMLGYLALDDLESAARVTGAKPYDRMEVLLQARASGCTPDARAAVEAAAQRVDYKLRPPFLLELARCSAEPAKKVAALRDLQRHRVFDDKFPLMAPRGLRELGEAEEKAGRSGDALAAYEALRALWSSADPGLPDLEVATARIAALQGRGP